MLPVTCSLKYKNDSTLDIPYLTVQAQRRSKEHSRSTSAMSGVGDEKSEVSEDPGHHMSLYSNGFTLPSMGRSTVVGPPLLTHNQVQISHHQTTLDHLKFEVSTWI